VGAPARAKSVSHRNLAFAHIARFLAASLADARDGGRVRLRSRHPIAASHSHATNLALRAAKMKARHTWAGV